MLPSSGVNVWSRLATAQALVERGTLAIDKEPSTAWNVDKIFVRGSFYSDKPPTLALLAAAIYYPLYHAGFRLDRGRNVAYSVITFLLIGVSTLLCLAAFHNALKLVGEIESGRALMTAGLAFATLLLPWATTFNNHAFSGAWTSIAFFLLLKARDKSGEKVALTAAQAGLAVGVASAVDTACLVFVLGFGVYILLSSNLRHAGAWYAAAAFLAMVPGMLANYAVAGDFRPLLLHPEFHSFPGSHWTTGQEHLTGIQRNHLAFALRYAAICLGGPNGFLLYNPLLLIALYEGLQTVITRQLFWREALLLLTLITLFAGYFFLYSSNYGGDSYSIRWLVTIIPLLWFLAFPFFNRWTKTKRWTYAAICSYSMIIAMIGVLDQWPPTLANPRTPAFVLNWRREVMPSLHALRSRE